MDEERRQRSADRNQNGLDLLDHSICPNVLGVVQAADRLHTRLNVACRKQASQGRSVLPSEIMASLVSRPTSSACRCVCVLANTALIWLRTVPRLTSLAAAISSKLWPQSKPLASRASL